MRAPARSPLRLPLLLPLLLLLAAPALGDGGTEVYKAALAAAGSLSPDYGYFALFGPVRRVSGTLLLDVEETAAGGSGTGSGAVLGRLLDGCTPFAPRNASRLAGGRWLAMVRRGNCYFTQKADNAFAAGAAGVFIVDSEDRCGRSGEVLEGAGGGGRMKMAARERRESEKKKEEGEKKKTIVSFVFFSSPLSLAFPPRSLRT